MIAIGTDIVEIGRVQAVWERQAQRFIQRILTDDEQRRCAACREPWRYLAKRFAAKEAIAKTFGTGIGAELRWHDLKILNASTGAPEVVLSARAQRLANSLGGSRVMLSLSDEKAYAVAFAVLLE